MPEKYNLSDVSFFFLLLALMAVPVNYDLYSIRLTDLFIVFSFVILFFTRRNIRVYQFSAVFLLILMTLTASQLVGFFYADEVKVSGAIFYLKWLMIFISIYLLHEHLRNGQSDILLLSRILLYVFVLLSAWVYVYVYLVSSGYIHGNIRVSFPFSRNHLQPDAHLYSSLLSILLFAYFFVLRKALEHSFIVSLVIAFFGVFALVLTGSRGGLVMLFIGVLVMSLYILTSKKILYKKISRRNIFFLLSMLMAGFYFGLTVIDFSDDYLKMINRAFNFDFSADQSSLGRVHKLQIAIDEVSNFASVFGVGPLSARLDWYDGIISILLSHGGLLLLSIIFFTTSYFLYSLMIMRVAYYYKLVFLSMLVMYVVSNLITEFIFVTRNFFPVFVSFAVAISYAKHDSFREKGATRI